MIVYLRQRCQDFVKETSVRDYWQKYLNGLQNHGTRILSVACGNSSGVKKAIWKTICSEFTRNNGHYLSIISHNVYMFNAGHVYKHQNKLYFKLITLTVDELLELNTDDLALLDKTVGKVS